MQVATQAITVTNTTAAPAHVTWTSSEPAVAVVPPTAVVLAGSPVTFEVHIEGQALGQLHAIATCSVQHGNSCAVSIQAEVQGALLCDFSCLHVVQKGWNSPGRRGLCYVRCNMT